MNERIKEYSDKMQKSYDFLKEDLASIRAGRANPHVLDKIKVDYYGTPTPLQQVGNVSVPEARIIQIAPWDKTLIKDIEKAPIWWWGIFRWVLLAVLVLALAVGGYYL